jgi:hypothetical protein
MNLRNFRLGSRPLTIGLIFGVIFALALVLDGFILSPVLGQFNSYIELALPLIFGLLAGRRASMLKGKVLSGVIAGFLTGLIGSLLTSAIGLISLLTNLEAIRQQYQQFENTQKPKINITDAMVIQNELYLLFISLLLTCLLAVAGGSLGGFLGRRRALVAPVEETPEEVITTTATPVQEDDETPASSYSSNGARRGAASRRSRNARRNRSMN